MALCARAQRPLLLLGGVRQTMARRQIFSIDGVFDSHLKEDTVLRVEKHWKPLLRSTVPKVVADFFWGGRGLLLFLVMVKRITSVFLFVIKRKND